MNYALFNIDCLIQMLVFLFIDIEKRQKTPEEAPTFLFWWNLDRIFLNGVETG